MEFAGTEGLGPKIRRQRRKLGLTLDELSGRSGISKPYLSLIETERVSNPPSDEKLQRIEQALAFDAGELLRQAHWLRTPKDVRAILRTLADQQQKPAAKPIGNVKDDLHEIGDDMRKRMNAPAHNAVPVINRTATEYPRDFGDLSYPSRAAKEFVSCPDVHDKDAFAARVHGDSMLPRYRADDIVIFSPAISPRSGDDCFIRFADGQTTFKRIFFESADGGGSAIRLQPRNEKYRAQILPAEQIAGLYKAVYKYQKIDGD